TTVRRILRSIHRFQNEVTAAESTRALPLNSATHLKNPDYKQGTAYKSADKSPATLSRLFPQSFLFGPTFARGARPVLQVLLAGYPFSGALEAPLVEKK